MKRIGMLVSGGFMARNILRTGVFEKLAQNKNNQIIIFVPEETKDEIHQECAKDNVSVIGYTPYVRRGFRIRRWMHIILFKPLVWNTSTQRFFKVGQNYERHKPAWWWPFLNKIAPVVSQLTWLKKLVRKFENSIFPEKKYDEIVKAQKLDVLFSSNIITGVDVAFLKSAKRLKIPSISMTKGWDILLYGLARFNSDHLIVQTTYTKNNAVNLQLYKENQITVSGFPQFDVYNTDEWRTTREGWITNMGLDPQRKTIFLGSSGIWSPHDHILARTIAQMINNNQFHEKMQLIVRPHFTDVHRHRYKSLKNTPHVIIDDSFHQGKFNDKYDATVADTYALINTLFHTDTICIFASTLALDATMLDKQILLMEFESRFDEDGNDMSKYIYDQEHFQHILKYKFAPVVKNKEEFQQELQNVLQNKDTHKSGRTKMKHEFLAYSDGSAAHRIAKTIETFE